MHGLADAARSRSEADWLVGINGTRAMTAFNSRDGGFFLTTVGRVQTPTLSIVVEREEKIRKHVARDYWEIKASSTPRPASTTASGSTRSGRRTRTMPSCAPTACGTPPTPRPSPAPCAASRRSSPKRPSPPRRASPLLYDLTTLQREANGRFGFSAKTTLSRSRRRCTRSTRC
jgi:DNA topoisomerase III